MREKIGDRLLRAGLISDRDLRTALAEQARTGERLGAVMVRLDVVSERQVRARRINYVARVRAYDGRKHPAPYACFTRTSADRTTRLCGTLIASAHGHSVGMIVDPTYVSLRFDTLFTSTRYHHRLGERLIAGRNSVRSPIVEHCEPALLA